MHSFFEMRKRTGMAKCCTPDFDTINLIPLQISLFEVVDEKNKKPKYNEDKFVEAVKVIEDVLDSHIGKKQALIPRIILIQEEWLFLPYTIQVK